MSLCIPGPQYGFYVRVSEKTGELGPSSFVSTVSRVSKALGVERPGKVFWEGPPSSRTPVGVFTLDPGFCPQWTLSGDNRRTSYDPPGRGRGGTRGTLLPTGDAPSH